MKYLVNRALLELHDKYDGDLGLLDDTRYSTKEDREAFSIEQIRTLGEYLENASRLKADCLSREFRTRIEDRMRELEVQIDPEVIAILHERVPPS